MVLQNGKRANLYYTFIYKSMTDTQGKQVFSGTELLKKKYNSVGLYIRGT